MNSLIIIAILLIIFVICFHKNREGISGNSNIHFITARTYGLNPKTLSDTARALSMKSGGSGELLGSGASSSGRANVLGNPHTRPSHSEARSNPLLSHQRMFSGGNLPTVQGDQIRTPNYVGPSVSGYYLHTKDIPTRNAYDITTNQTFANRLSQTVAAEESAASDPEYQQEIEEEPYINLTDFPKDYNIPFRRSFGF